MHKDMAHLGYLLPRYVWIFAFELRRQSAHSLTYYLDIIYCCVKHSLVSYQLPYVFV